jgi:hypothetical protein
MSEKMHRVRHKQSPGKKPGSDHKQQNDQDGARPFAPGARASPPPFRHDRSPERFPRALPRPPRIRPVRRRAPDSSPEAVNPPPIKRGRILPHAERE